MTPDVGGGDGREAVAIARALDRVLERYDGILRAVAARCRLSDADFSDLQQRVRIRLHKALGTAERIEAVQPLYVKQTARWAAIDLIRGLPPNHASIDAVPLRPGERGWIIDPGTIPGGINPETEYEHKEVAEMCMRAVEALPARYRAPVRMWLEGYEYHEIVREMSQNFGWTEAVTRNVLHRGKLDLRKRLSDMGFGPEGDND
jgi:DNA-directed RNA polymerase specialized sigma24 family protein